MQSGSTLSDFISAIRNLAPLIAEHRQTFDRDRCLPEQLYAPSKDIGKQLGILTMIP